MTRFGRALAFALLIFCAGDACGQFRIPPIRIPVRVPVRPVPVPHHIPHVPHHIPGVSPAGEREKSKPKKPETDDAALPWGAIATGGGGLALIGAGTLWFLRPRRARIRIVRTPGGDAPENVRRAWVGLELPLASGETCPRVFQARGVLTDQDSGSTVGYMVDGKAAVQLLAVQSPDAAAWWREHVPEVMTTGYHLGFSAGDCQRLDLVD